MIRTFSVFDPPFVFVLNLKLPSAALLDDTAFIEVVSTRLLIYAGSLITIGVIPIEACISTIVWSLTDERELQDSIEELVRSIFTE